MEEFQCSLPRQGVAVPSEKPEHGGLQETIEVGKWSRVRTEGTSIVRWECCYIVSARVPSALLKGEIRSTLKSRFY